MRLVLTNNGSYPRVGDRPQEHRVRRALSKWESGAFSDQDLRNAGVVLRGNGELYSPGEVIASLPAPGGVP